MVGASLTPSVILILGFANLFADGFSMAIGNYLAVKTHNEYVARERKKEEWENDNLIEEENKRSETFTSIKVSKRNCWKRL